MNAFSKYAKTGSDNLLESGGVYHQTSVKTICAHSGELNGNFLNSLLEELNKLQGTQADTMCGSNWTYLGPAQITVTFLKLPGKLFSI